MSAARCCRSGRRRAVRSGCSARRWLMLQGLMLLLLLAVCGNTANLMLARASARQREVGVRLALGAGPWRIVSLLLTENVAAGAARRRARRGDRGVGDRSDARGADHRRVPDQIPDRASTASASPSRSALGALCGLIFGIAPASSWRGSIRRRRSASGARTAGRSAMRNALMAVQVALALVVLMAAALFLRSFSETRDTDPGFRREGVLLAAYDLSGRNLSTRSGARLHGPAARATARAAGRGRGRHRDVGPARHPRHAEPRASRWKAAPQTGAAPTAGADQHRHARLFRGDGNPAARRARVRRPAATPRRRRRRSSTRSSCAATSRRGEAIGRRLETRGSTFTIVGVVRQSVNESFGEKPTPFIYLSYRDRPSPAGEIHLRTRAGAEILLGPEVERVVRDLDPTLPVYDIRTLSDHVEKNLLLRRIPARMFVVLGPLLLILAAIGIYAVVAYAVSQRTKEIGVRLALGATNGRVVSQIVCESLRVVVVGGFVGWMAALVFNSHLLRGPLYLSVFAGVPALLFGVAALACWLPAQRASALDPIAALRQE